jgi:hypothetical protein
MKKFCRICSKNSFGGKEVKEPSAVREPIVIAIFHCDHYEAARQKETKQSGFLASAVGWRDLSSAIALGRTVKDRCVACNMVRLVAATIRNADGGNAGEHRYWQRVDFCWLTEWRNKHGERLAM